MAFRELYLFLPVGCARLGFCIPEEVLNKHRHRHLVLEVVQAFRGGSTRFIRSFINGSTALFGPWPFCFSVS
jgi:hypothetical protein